MRRQIIPVLFFIAALALSIGPPAGAESYLSMYGGGAFPNNVDWHDNLGLGKRGTIDLDNSPTVGVKIGHWFTESAMPYFGVEVEGNLHFPDWSAVTTERSLGFILVPPVTSVVTADTTLFAGLFNFLARYPRGPVRPYAGGGLGFAVWDIGDQSLATVGTFKSETDTAFAWDLIAGLDLRVNRRLSLFGEYKYLGADFSFPDFIGMDINYRASLAYGGLRMKF